jgi:endonuclease/exonuclease/phosphatase (EEP) superfamily protein YafD
VEKYQGSTDLQRTEITTAAPGAPPVPMNAIWRTIRSYVLWQHERGTLHYDIMVTLILIFIFLSPRVIDFNDKPVARKPHPTEVTVTADIEGRLSYVVAANAVTPGDDQAVRDQLLRIIEPISGAVSIVSYDPVIDHKGAVQSYKVLATRE